MKRAYLLSVFCLLSAFIILSCSSRKPDPSTKSVALGNIAVDRCFFYTEGEDFKTKSGGNFDVKEGASKKKCLGIMWGGNKTDFVTYEFNMENPSESNIMAIKVAIENKDPQSYNIFIDDKFVQTATMGFTGGYGYEEDQWKSYSVPLGPIAKGTHTLTIRPAEKSGIMNIDCLALGKSD